MGQDKTMAEDYRIIVDVDGVEIHATCVNGHVGFRSETTEYARRAASAAHRRVKDVPVISGMPYKLFPAGEETPMQVLAALYAVDPGRTSLVEAPREVWDEIAQYSSQTVSGVTLGR